MILVLQKSQLLVDLWGSISLYPGWTQVRLAHGCPPLGASGACLAAPGERFPSHGCPLLGASGVLATPGARFLSPAGGGYRGGGVKVAQASVGPPCGHSVSFFVPPLEPYSETLFGNHRKMIILAIRITF
jgi:hypothetical protein